MATLVSAPVRSWADGLLKLFSSAQLSGIVPDQSHLNDGGYHCSVEDLRKFGNGNDYSNVRADDKNFNPRYGAAIDISLNKADMVKVYARVHAVWADKTDPRRKYFNAINCWDGSGSAVRLDFVANTATWASDDHTWHVHGEMRRRYLLDAIAGRAGVSMFKGESRAVWVSREGAGPAVSLKPGARAIKLGSRGADVAFVQRWLGIDDDGIFGPITDTAVRRYQAMRGVKITGVVDVVTWREMGVVK